MTRLTFLDTNVVLQNIVATPAATVITRCLFVKPFVVVLEVRRFVVIVVLFVFGSFVVRHFSSATSSPSPL